MTTKKEVFYSSATTFAFGSFFLAAFFLLLLSFPQTTSAAANIGLVSAQIATSSANQVLIQFDNPNAATLSSLTAGSWHINSGATTSKAAIILESSYPFTIRLTFDGPLAASYTAPNGLYVDASGVTDSGGNTNAVVVSGSSIAVGASDSVAPTLSPVTIASNNASTTLAKSGNIVTLSFTSNKGLFTPSVTIGTHSASVSRTSPTVWTASTTMDGTDVDGSVSFTVTAPKSIQGIAGANVTAITSGANVRFDKTAPTLTSVTVSSNNASTTLAKTGDLITLSFTGSENLGTSAGNPTATVDGQSAAVALVSASTTWTATYTMLASDAEGTLPISIVFTDSAGNSGTTVTAVTSGANVIFDRTAPLIILAGANPDSVFSSSNSPYTDPGATVSDSREGTINSSLVTTGSVNRALPGSYTLTYNASDSAGNAATAVARTVQVNLIGSGGVFTGNLPRLPGEKAPRPQIIYPGGRVVYLNEPTSISPPVPVAAPLYIRTLMVGSSGDDVSALQTFLEGKGLLVMPPGVSKGYFGSLTKRALMKYQQSISLEAVGIVGPKTRAALNQ